MPRSTYSPDYAELCAVLARTRKSAGLSQRRLAERLGVPHTWVAKVETAERRLDLIEFRWFCEACGADPAKVAAEVFAGGSTGRSAKS